MCVVNRIAVNYNQLELNDCVELWNDCFSDYPTSMVMTNDTLTARFNKFDLSEDLSFIIKESDKLLDLILIGFREFDGIMTAWGRWYGCEAFSKTFRGC